MKNATLTDIARGLKLSPSTVSKALNDHPAIKAETKDLVRKYADKVGYRPNPIARSLKNNRSTTIGIIVPEIKHDFFASAISGIEEVAFGSGYTILLCQSNENYEREVVHTSVLMHHRVAGVIASIAQNTRSVDHFRDLQARNIPLVFFDRAPDDIEATKVVIDDYQSAFDAVTYLIDKGYTRIAHLAGPKDLGICMRRMHGYADALRKREFEVDDRMIRHGGLHEQNGYDSMDAWIRAGTIPDAIFAVNDPVAIGAFQRIREEGLRIPDDVAIVGFSNNKITTLIDPQMTTIDQPSFEMGRKAAALLIEIIENDGTPVQEVVLHAALVPRGSA